MNKKRVKAVKRGKLFRKLTTTLALSLLMAMMFSITVFASELSDWVQNNTTWDSSNNPKLPSEVSSMLSQAQLSGYTSVLTVTSPDGSASVAFYYKPEDETTMLSRISNSNNNQQVNTKVTDITQNLNISADVDGATTALSGFIPFISLILGIIVFLITVGMTIFSAFDLCYIAFPVFRNKCEDAKASGNRAMTRQSSSGESTLRWVSQDAQFAVESTTNGDSGKNPFMVYFGKRIISYMALAVLLFILLTGNISIFTNIAVNLMSGIVDILGKLSFN